MNRKLLHRRRILAWQRLAFLGLAFLGLAFLGMAFLVFTPVSVHAQVDTRLPVAGRVLDPAGAPIAGARVSLAAEPDPYTSAVMVLDGRHRLESIAETTTDEGGWFTVSAPDVGLWRVRVDAPGYVPMRKSLVPLTDGVVLPALTLVANDAVTVSVVDGRGEPVAGAQVWGSSLDRERWTSGLRDGWRPASRATLADEEGRATVPRASGEPIRVQSFAPGYVEAEPREVSGAKDGGRTTVTLRDGVAFDVFFEDPRGGPLVGAAIRSGGAPLVILGDEGRATFVASPGKRIAFQVVTEARQHESGNLDVPEDGEVPEATTMRLPEPVTVTGRVIEAETRAVVPGALVWRQGNPRRAVRTDRTGTYDIVLREASAIRLAGAAAGFDVGGTTVHPRGPGATEAPSVILSPAAILAGRVVDRDGQGIAGAGLTARDEPAGGFPRRWTSGPDRKTISLPDGSFRLSGMAVGRRWRLSARKDGYAPASVLVASGDVGEIVLDPPRRAFGRVEDGEERPIEGAEVAIVSRKGFDTRAFMRSLDDEAAVGRARTDAEGRFRFEDLASGEYALRVARAGFADKLEALVEVSAETRDSDLGTLRMSPVAPIEGRVVDSAERPIAGARVGWFTETTSLEQGKLLRLERLMRGMSQITTDADGRFLIEAVAEGERIQVMASAEGYTRGEGRMVRAPTESPVEIVLERGGRLSGTVVDTGGAGVEGARLSIGVRRGDNFSGHHSGSTDADGRFEIEGVAIGTATIQAHKAGYPTGHLRDIEVRADAKRDDLRIVLDAAGTLFGTVTDSERRPVPGAAIVVSSRDPANMLLSNADARSDGDGAYRLFTASVGRHRIAVTHEGFPPFEKVIEIRGGEQRFDVELRAGLEIVGVVLDEHGAPIAGANVSIDTGARYTPFASTRTVHTARDGSFRLDGLSEGRFRVVARAEGHAPERSEPVEVGDFETPFVELRLSRGATIEGRIRGLEIGDRPRLSVLATKGLMRESRQAKLSSDGDAFTITNLDPGQWTVRGEISGASRFASEQVEVLEGADRVPVELVFGAGFTMSGVVTRGGEPVPNVMLMINSGTLNVQATTDGSGAYRVEGLDEGSVMVMLSEPGSNAWQNRQVTIDSDVEVDFEIETNAIAGQVVDVEGRPVANAMVRIESRAGSSGLDAAASRFASTDAQGRFTLEGVAAGAYTLVVTHGEHSVSRQPVSVVEGTTGQVEVVLEPADRVRIGVRRLDGRALDQVQVIVLDDQGTRVLNLSASVTDGIAEVASIPAGTWRVAIGAPNAAWTETRITVGAVEASPAAAGVVASVNLPPGASLDVQVPAIMDGRTAARLSVRDVNGNDILPTIFRKPDSAGVGADAEMWRGRATITGLPSGTWLLEVRSEDGRSWQGVVEGVAGVVNEAVLE